MSHENESLSVDTEQTVEQTPAAVPELEPAFLVRAGGILAGQVRSEDYLAEPAEIVQAVADELRRVAEEEGIEATPAAKRQLLNDWTLQHHYPNESLLARCTDRGVIVLAAGKEQIYEVRQRFSPDYNHGFVLIFPSAV